MKRNGWRMKIKSTRKIEWRRTTTHKRKTQKMKAGEGEKRETKVENNERKSKLFGRMYTRFKRKVTWLCGGAVLFWLTRTYPKRAELQACVISGQDGTHNFHTGSWVAAHRSCMLYSRMCCQSAHVFALRVIPRGVKLPRKTKTNKRKCF
jgi:hypothetical protein